MKLFLLLFSFALLTDVHISNHNQRPLEDLRHSVDEINATQGLDFVLISGDITESGDKKALMTCKSEFDRLNIPYYITNGNHETTWSESGVMDFNRVFGDNRFAFVHENVLFIGFNSGPVLKMADGHVAPQDITWAEDKIRTMAPNGERIIVVTHYPLQFGDVDNWYEVTDMLRKYNTQCLLGGHYHRNLLFDCDGIPDYLSRSNLRDKDGINGYAVISVDADSIRLYEKRIGEPLRHWASTAFEDKQYGPSNPALRPSFEVNNQYANVHQAWQRRMGVGIYASPAMADGRVYIGDDEGNFYCMNATDGTTIWQFKAGARIFSTAAIADQRVVFGSTDDCIYCLNTKDGSLAWKITTRTAVMGSPVIHDGVVYIGGSDGCMRALRLEDGSEVWTFAEMKNYHNSRPTIYKGRLYFGAWDSYMYCLNLKDGHLEWKWNNGTTSDKLSPAAVWPVIAHDRVYFSAPDRYMTCLDANDGHEIWRTNRYKVRETAGMDEAQTMVFSKCMWDTVVCFSATSLKADTVWATNCGFGYEHAPCMPLEKDGTVFVGTKNGLVLGLEAKTGRILWQHKIGSSLIQTMLPLSKHDVLVTSTDGTVTRLKIE